MPAKLKVRIVAGRDLPIMDRASELTDAFVEVKFSNNTYKTDVYKKSLNPQWNSDWFRFEVDDENLQDEPLQIKVLDHDTYSAHDAIGKVYIELNPLVTKERRAVISGWFPIYDTMHGIRGELNVIIKLDLFSDFNKFRQSSCGVQFFCTSGVPQGYRIQGIHGFVEELVVNDDPEYQWIDKIRSQRASNEARQMQFTKLSGELQRKIGLKVLELGGNAVIGYIQCFDLEGESGVVVRAIGTSVMLGKYSQVGASPHSSSPVRDLMLTDEAMPSSPTTITPTKLSSSPAKVTPTVPVGRRSSDSDIGTPPKGGSLAGSSGSGGGGSCGKQASFHRPVLQQQSIEMLEFPFFSIKAFPPGFLVHIGGVVSARSVKLLDRIHNPDEPETRDAWWMEIRTEIRSHAKAMGCHAVIGYSEQTTICGEIIVLSAIGTAAIVSLRMDPEAVLRQNVLTMSLDRSQFEKEKDKDKKLHVDVNLANQAAAHRIQLSDSDDGPIIPNCSICHIPYNDTSLPFPVNLEMCHICQLHKVPDVLFTTLEPPSELPFVGKGCLIQARICRVKKEVKGEPNAKEISDNLPFMEYELYSQLVNKLKIKGMNTIFGLRIQVVVGERMLVAIATGTAVYTQSLPVPALPRVAGKFNGGNLDTGLVDLQKKVNDMIVKNQEIYNLYPPDNTLDTFSLKCQVTDEEEELSDAELSSGNKDTFVLEIDDAEDAAVVSTLLDPPPPDGFDSCTTETMPGVQHIVCNLQMFTRVWRGEISSINNKSFSDIFDNILKSTYFKLRTMTPCCLCHLDFDVELHDEDEIQISVTGICTGLGEPPSLSNGLIHIAPQGKADSCKPPTGQLNLYDHHYDASESDHEEMMFHMESVTDVTSGNTGGRGIPPQTSPRPSKGSGQSEKRVRYYSGPKHNFHQGIELTPLSYVPGGRIEQYLGHLNFFIIRETTSVRESGGLNGFLHSFVAEVMAICRAHVMALGGNALVAYQMSECVLDDHLHKNQSQCLVNVCGDVVQVLYGVELMPLHNVSGGGSSGRTGSVSPLVHSGSKKGTPPKNSPKSDKVH